MRTRTRFSAAHAIAFQFDQSGLLEGAELLGQRGSTAMRLIRSPGWGNTAAQIHSVRFADDLDGGEAAETVAFAVDGTVFEIDLSADNAATLRAELAA